MAEIRVTTDEGISNSAPLYAAELSRWGISRAASIRSSCWPLAGCYERAGRGVHRARAGRTRRTQANSSRWKAARGRKIDAGPALAGPARAPRTCRCAHPRARRVAARGTDPRVAACPGRLSASAGWPRRRCSTRRVIRIWRSPSVPRSTAGKWVVCDRFSDSTRAYQGAGGDVPLSVLEGLERTIVWPTRPDLTLILDLPAEQAMERLAGTEGPV